MPFNIANSCKKYIVTISIIFIVTGLLLSSTVFAGLLPSGSSSFPVLLTPKTSTTDAATSTDRTITVTPVMSTFTEIPSVSAQPEGDKGQIVEGGPPRPPVTSPVNLQVCKRIEGGGPLRSATDFDIGVFFRSTPTSRLSPPTPIQVNPSTGCGSVQIPQDTYYLVGERPRRDIQGHYTPVRGDGCEGTITRAAPGSTIRCNLVNRYVPPPISLPEIAPGQSRVVITKMVFNDDKGTKLPSDFRLSMINNGRFSYYFNTAGPLTSAPPLTSQVVAQIVPPGRYLVEETAKDLHYPSSARRGCDGTIGPGETRFCTIYNDDNPATTPPPEGQSRLVITKRIINNDGGTARLNDFTVKVYLSPDSLPCSIFNLQGCSQTDRPFSTFQGFQQRIIRPGYFAVAESPNLPGYLSSSNCPPSTIGPGETRFCTIYNDDIPGHFTSRIPTFPVIP